MVSLHTEMSGTIRPKYAHTMKQLKFLLSSLAILVSLQSSWAQQVFIGYSARTKNVPRFDHAANFGFYVNDRIQVGATYIQLHKHWGGRIEFVQPDVYGGYVAYRILDKKVYSNIKFGVLRYKQGIPNYVVQYNTMTYYNIELGYQINDHFSIGPGLTLYGVWDPADHWSTIYFFHSFDLISLELKF
ncbi:MAG TPA: hypothetical protein DCE13_04580 [Cryomorphaceae bacterium]|jgi:hypothetical protein|nr:MAG: hypothetical protein ABR98_07740 [Cryomorphaceae bacterium BACL7 MAG-120910-bin2]KRO66289.1 MAG: hypothetical protein ABR84_01795 [Cryomorphaceae bacterium BACL21 MAG-121220-bin10]HAB31801.1 hypothetical protein [Cryomorphaceae bacterium]